ncbi:hypothetical protein [Kiloniella litopenaei]|uniref:hypothetical protein n=1 Tax=Kiloniella litopenaei TaxID=1549748 RepID=UPI003BA8C2ED
MEDFDNNPDAGTVGEEYSELDTLNALADLPDTDEDESPQGTTENHQGEEADGEQPEAMDEQSEGDEENEPSEDTNDQTDEEEQEDSEKEPEDTYVVKINGEEQRVNLDELKSGYQRQSDYTRKAQELADHKNQFAQQAHQERLAVGQYLQKIEELAIGQEPDWATLAANDPATYVQLKADWDNRVQQLNQIKQGLGQQNQQHQREQQQSSTQRLEKFQQKLPELFPEWDTKDKAVEGQGKIVNYAASHGITQEQLGQMQDPVGLLILDKARQFDELKASKPKVNNKVRKAPASLRPGASKSGTNTRSRQQRDAMNILRKTGSEDAALAALDFLDD